jgi:hypothetical protein
MKSSYYLCKNLCTWRIIKIILSNCFSLKHPKLSKVLVFFLFRHIDNICFLINYPVLLLIHCSMSSLTCYLMTPIISFWNCLIVGHTSLHRQLQKHPMERKTTLVRLLSYHDFKVFVVLFICSLFCHNSHSQQNRLKKYQYFGPQSICSRFPHVT